MATEKLGRYEILQTLGHGAMGVVYKARDPLIGRIVAIKAMTLNDLQPEEKDRYGKRFRQEAKAVGSLSHPNLVTIYDFGETDDLAYIAMEFMQGKELEQVKPKELSVDDVLNIIIQVASGLNEAHEHGVVHRDIKPANIMLLKNNIVKICDFGIAKLSEPLMHTRVGAVLGSPMYMSPEQVLGQLVDNRSDLFSLGIMLYQLLTGEMPFAGRTESDLMHSIINDTPKKPSELNPDVNAMLDGIVAKCLAKKPEDRYQHAAELEHDLRECRGVLLHARTGEAHHRHYYLSPAGTSAQKLPPWKRAGLALMAGLAAYGLFALLVKLFSH